MPNPTAWDTASEGLQGLTEFVGTVTDAYFDLNSTLFEGGSAYGESVILVLECSIDKLIDPIDYNFDTARLYFSVGKADGWNILNGGQQIVPKKGSEIRFGNSKYQQLVKKVHKDLNVPIRERGEPTDAQVWLGLSFHWVQESNEITINRDGKKETVNSRITLPRQWMQNTLPPLGAAARA